MALGMSITAFKQSAGFSGATHIVLCVDGAVNKWVTVFPSGHKRFAFDSQQYPFHAQFQQRIKSFIQLKYTYKGIKQNSTN